MKTPVATLLAIISLTCLAILPSAKAVNPPPDGAYAGGNTAEGQSALLSLSSGTYNTAVGLYSLLINSTGNFNTGVGAGTLLLNTAEENTAVGAGALLSNTSGVDNAAVGTFCLFSSTTGSFNTATGARALLGNTTGSENTATGTFALNINTEGSFNTAVGAFALANNTGSENTAVGVDTLFNNTAGGNTAIGARALRLNTTGFQNTGVGSGALQSNTNGGFNTALGEGALTQNTGDGNTACGNVALFNNTTGTNNTALGNVAGTSLTTGSNNIDIGYNVTGLAGESNTIRIGNTDITNTFISGISGTNSPGGLAVFCNSDGKLGVISSSARFKENVQPMDRASEAILALRPVSFRYKTEFDPTGMTQFGLVAEDVEKVKADLVVRDREGKPYSVRYEQVNAMLLNEFLKEHAKVQKLEATLEAVNERLKDQEGKLGRICAQIESSRTTAQAIVSHR